MIKSHKPKVKKIPEEEDDVMPQHRHRKMTLAQLEQRVKKHKNSGKSSVTTTLNNVINGINKAAAYANRDIAKQSGKMPSERDVNKMLWG